MTSATLTSSSTPIAAANPIGLAGRLRWAISDVATTTGRTLLHWRQQPGVIVGGLAFPILMVVMFGYVLGGAMSVPGGGDYREFLMPGLFAMAMAFGLESTVVAVHADASAGITDRFRSLPMTASAVVLGRGVADFLYSALGLVVLLVTGLVVGWSPNDGLLQAVAAIGLLLWLRFAFLWVGIFLGLLIKNAEGVMFVQVIIWPFGFLSSAYASPDSMPAVLGAFAEWNPISSTITAIRDLFGNPGFTGESWVAQHAVLMAIVWPLVLTAIFLPLAIRQYRSLSR